MIVSSNIVEIYAFQSINISYVLFPSAVAKDTVKGKTWRETITNCETLERSTENDEEKNECSGEPLSR